MEQVYDLATGLLSWLVAAGALQWLLGFFMACLTVVGMIWVTYRISSIQRATARAILWHLFEALFFVAPALAAFNGGWWWLSPPIVAILTGILIRIDEGDPVDPVMGRLQKDRS